MVMRLEEVVEEVKQKQIVLVAPGQPWPGTRITPRMQAALRRHEKSLAQLMSDGAIALCPSKNLHRSHWKYDGVGKFTCGLCQRFSQLGICW